MILLRLLVLVAALVGSGPLTGRAQDGTPAAGLVPVPAACTADRRSVAEIIAFLPETAATPSSERGGPIRHAEHATTVPLALPPGQPADAETVAAVTATMGQLFACYNADDLVGAFSLLSDGYIRAGFASGGGTRAELAARLARPATPVAGRYRAAAFVIIDAVVLADRRVAALLRVSDPDDDEPVLVYFVEQEGRWLIDEIPEP